MSKKIYFSQNDKGQFAFSDENIAIWFYKNLGYDLDSLVLDDDEMTKQYYKEHLSEQKERLLDLLKER